MTAAVHGRSPILNQAGAAISGDTFFLPGLSLQDSSRMRAGGTAPEITTHRFRAGENGGNLGWEFGWEPRGESQDPLDDSENTRHYRNAFPCGPVAQLGEHMVCNHGVGSSSLPRSTNQFNDLPVATFCLVDSWLPIWCTPLSKTGAFILAGSGRGVAIESRATRLATMRMCE